MFDGEQLSVDDKNRLRWSEFEEADDYPVIEELVAVAFETTSVPDEIYRAYLEDYLRNVFRKSKSELARRMLEVVSGTQNVTTADHVIRVMYTTCTDFIEEIVKLFKFDEFEKEEYLAQWRMIVRAQAQLHDMAKKFIIQNNTVLNDTTQDHAILSAQIAEQFLNDAFPLLFTPQMIETIVFSIKYHHLLEHIDKGNFSIEQAAAILSSFKSRTGDESRTVKPVNFLCLSLLSMNDVLSVKGYERFAEGNITALIALLEHLYEPQTQQAIAYPLLLFVQQVTEYIVNNPEHYNTEASITVLRKIRARLERSFVAPDSSNTALNHVIQAFD